MDPISVLKTLGPDVLSAAAGQPMLPDYLTASSGGINIGVGGIGTGAPAEPFQGIFRAPSANMGATQLTQSVIVALITAGIVAVLFKKGRA